MENIFSESNCNCSLCKNNNSFTMPTEIIEAVKKQELVLFCGAGISTESNLVLPISFYMEILDFLNDEYNLNINTDISFSDLMSKFCSIVPNGRKELIRRIKSRFDMIDSFPELHNNATRFHKEVAKIPQINTIITTNWDNYFEDECSASPIIDNKDTALWNTFKKRVFKIHGSINHIGSIVATTEDYEACYDRLKTQPIGDRLKTLLGSCCVVFIGFSFGDEDLNKILNILDKNLEEYSNQYYLVTIDKSLENNDDQRIIPIITDGTYFIHSLKNILIRENLLLSDDIYELSEYTSYILLENHYEWTSSTDFYKLLNEYPELLLSVAYQDGLIHAYQHCFSNKSDGSYLNPYYLSSLIYSYDMHYKDHIDKKRYTYAYYDLGFLDGLINIKKYTKTKLELLTPMFVYKDEYFDRVTLAIDYIKSNRDLEIFNYCKEIVNKFSLDTVPHFPPWFC